MSRLLNRLYGRVYGWFDSKEDCLGLPRWPARFSHKAHLTILSLEDRVVPATIPVLNADDSGAGSLRQAIIDANATTAQDTIVFDSSFFNTSMKTITLATALPGLTNSVIINGPGADLATVDGNHLASVFDLTGSPFGTPITINDIRLTGGSSADRGGAINVQDEVLTLSGVTLEGNTSTNGGGAIGVSDAAGVLTIDNSIIRDNVAGGNGGGLDIHSYSVVTIDRTTITGNTAANTGGFVYFYNGMNFKITNSTISGNQSSGGNGGGALYFWGGIGFYGLTIQNCTISGNTATTNGGGINFHYVGGSPVIQNTTIVGNSAANGGGIAVPFNSPNITIASTIVAQEHIRLEREPGYFRDDQRARRL